jgi:hypothetical protein
VSQSHEHVLSLEVELAGAAHATSLANELRSFFKDEVLARGNEYRCERCRCAGARGRAGRTGRAEPC